MKRISVLAKTLFLFFAVISIGLVTVSCSDDDDDDAKQPQILHKKKMMKTWTVFQ